MTETGEPIKIYRGLKGVYFDRSPCTFIDGKAGELRYRGYSIHDLAEHSSFEETTWLLLNGDLPSRAAVRGFRCRTEVSSRNCLQPSSTLFDDQIRTSDGCLAHGYVGAVRLRSGNGR